MDTFNLAKLIPPAVRSLLTPILVFIVSVILSIFVGNLGLKQLRAQNSALTQAKNTEKILTKKRDVLAEIADEAAQFANTASIALPSKNPSLIIVSQIKRLLAANSLILSNLKIGGEVKDKGGYLHEEISFDITGGFSQITGFLKSLDIVLPLVSIEKTKITGSTGEIKATVTLKGFWADLPTSLPTLASPTSGLSDAEKDVLTKLSGFTPPFFSEVAPQGPQINENPFGL